MTNWEKIFSWDAFPPFEVRKKKFKCQRPLSFMIICSHSNVDITSVWWSPNGRNPSHKTLFHIVINFYKKKKFMLKEHQRRFNRNSPYLVCLFLFFYSVLTGKHSDLPYFPAYKTLQLGRRTLILERNF